MASRRASAKYQRRIYAEIRNLLNRLKDKPCADCQGWFNPWQMDFDHRDASTKKDCVALLARHGNNRIEVCQEVAKCDVVCSNCHRDRTQKRLMLKILQEVQ